ncbi:MAG: sugar phosphate isomerase/epimerase [Verrucomicrobia bacterium]|nr:sugar phosphate isomerase/epimerase [Verrucomicrobiota bacterium]
MNTPVPKPVLRHVVNLWTLVWHPTQAREWTLERKLRAVKDAGFDGFTTQLTPKHAKLADQLGLMRVGYFASSNPREFASLLRSQKEAGALHVNVQLGDHDTPTPVAIRLARKLIAEGKKLGLEVAVEVHRDTCTETPEKTYALADGYEKATGELLPMTWDYSHIAVVKHLLAPFWPRLGVRPDLIQHAQQFHLRPFNGHHCQIPVTDGRGHLTPEFLDYVPFMDQVMETWLAAASPGREFIAVPELGPLKIGYRLHSFPSSWEDAKVLRGQIEKSWCRALKTWNHASMISRQRIQDNSGMR